GASAPSSPPPPPPSPSKRAFNPPSKHALFARTASSPTDSTLFSGCPPVHLRRLSMWSRLLKDHVTHNFAPVRWLRPIRLSRAPHAPLATPRMDHALPARAYSSPPARRHRSCPRLRLSLFA